MKNLIDKYKESIFNIGTAYFDLSGQVNNDRIILNLYKSEFKNGLSVGLVLKLGELTNSAFGKNCYDLNIKKIIGNQLILCDGTSYQFNDNKINELGIEREVIDNEYKLTYKNSNLEEYYSLINNEYLLVKIRDKKKDEDVYTYSYENNNSISYITNHLFVVSDENSNGTNTNERLFYFYNEDNTCYRIDVLKGDITIKKIFFEYEYNSKYLNKITIYKNQSNSFLLEQEYEITKTDEEITFKDCITTLTKSFVLDDRGNFRGSIVDEFGILINIEDGVVTPYYNKFTSETDREKIRVKYHFDSNNRVCDIEGYNKMHSIRKYQDNKLLLRCDGCFKDVGYLGNVLSARYISTSFADNWIVTSDSGSNYIEGLKPGYLFKMDLSVNNEIHLNYKDINKKAVTGILIFDEFTNETLKICITYEKDNQFIKEEFYDVCGKYFAFPIYVENRDYEIDIKIYNEVLANKVIQFNAFVIDKCICNKYEYNQYGELVSYIEKGVLRRNVNYSDTHYDFSGNVVTKSNDGTYHGVYLKNLINIEKYINEDGDLERSITYLEGEPLEDESYQYSNKQQLIKIIDNLTLKETDFTYREDYSLSSVKKENELIEYERDLEKPLISRINFRKSNNLELLKSHGFNYDNTYSLTRLIENSVNKYQYVYEEEGFHRLVAVLINNVLIESYEYDMKFPHLLSKKVINGLQETYQYDVFGNLRILSRGTNEVFTFTYNDDNLLTNIKLNNQLIVEYQYEYGRLIRSIKNGTTQEYIYDENDNIVNKDVINGNENVKISYSRSQMMKDSLEKIIEDYTKNNDKIFATTFKDNVYSESDYNLLNDNNDEITSLKAITYDLNNFPLPDSNSFDLSVFIKPNDLNKDLICVDTVSVNNESKHQKFKLYINSNSELELYVCDYNSNEIKQTLFEINPNKFNYVRFTLSNSRLSIYLNCYKFVELVLENYKLNKFHLYYNQEIENTLALLLFCRNQTLNEMDSCNLYLRFNNIQEKLSIEDGEYNYLYTKDITYLQSDRGIDELTFVNTTKSLNGIAPRKEYININNDKDTRYIYDKEIKSVCLNEMGLVYDFNVFGDSTISFNLKAEQDSVFIYAKEDNDTLYKLYQENNKCYFKVKDNYTVELDVNTLNWHNYVITLESIEQSNELETKITLYVDDVKKIELSFKTNIDYYEQVLMFHLNKDDLNNVFANRISSLVYSSDVDPNINQLRNKDRFKFIKTYNILGMLIKNEVYKDDVLIKNNNYVYNENKLLEYDGSERYEYDDNNNLTYHTGTQYQYDDRNRLVKEIKDNQTIEYRYDVRDNITHIIKNGTCIYSYSYDNKDRLVMTNGVNVTYQNTSSVYPTRIDTSNFALDLTWQGNRLYVCSRTQNNSQVGVLRFTYDHKGLRKTKYNIQRGITHTYTYDEQDRLIVERRSDNKTLRYYYDTNNMLCSFSLNGVMYFYERDAFGNINHLIDKNGNIVVSYSCKAYGQDMSYVDNTSFGLGDINPFRYKGYYYDVETGLFMMGHRYYSPELCRFIQPDDIEYLDPENINGLNLYCYCFNNPIMYVDPDGHEPKWWQWALFGVGVALVAVAAGMAIIGTGGVAAFGMGALIGSLSIGAVGAVAGGAIGYATEGVDGILGGALAGFGIGAIAGFVIGGSVGSSIYGSQLGTTYQGVGKLVKNPKIEWLSSKFPHVGQRMAERNVSSKLIGKTLKNGYAFMQTSDKYLIVGRKAAVVITSAGEVITTWASNNYDQKLMDVLRSIFGF